MKLFFGIFITSVIIMFYGLYTNNLNMIITFGFLSIASCIFSTQIGLEDLIKEIFEKNKK